MTAKTKLDKEKLLKRLKKWKNSFMGVTFMESRELLQELIYLIERGDFDEK